MTAYEKSGPAGTFQPGWLALAVLTAVSVCAWGVWYYRGLYLEGRLLPASGVTAETLPGILRQHVLVNLPGLLSILTALWIGRRSGAAEEMGLTGKERKKGAVPLAFGLCLLALAAALRFADGTPLDICCRWVYYLVFTAFMEEAVFRGLLPFLAGKSGVSRRAVWVIPGVLFAGAHTMMPVVVNGFSVGIFVSHLLAVLLGYTAAHLGFYALRRWSGTLWLAVLVHGLLDFLSVF